MKNFSTWILIMFMAMFWVFRIIVAFTTEFGIDFGGIEAKSMQIEVILLFVTLLAFILVVRRNLLGAIIYLIGYGAYFGVDFFNAVLFVAGGGILTASSILNVIISLVGVALPIAVLFDMLMDKQRKLHPVDKKTDWFYKNEQYDREMDERADKNQYRTL